MIIKYLIPDLLMEADSFHHSLPSDPCMTRRPGPGPGKLSTILRLRFICRSLLVDSQMRPVDSERREPSHDDDNPTR